MSFRKKPTALQPGDTLAAVAFQDHLVRSLGGVGSLSLSDPVKPARTRQTAVSGGAATTASHSKTDGRKPIHPGRATRQAPELAKLSSAASAESKEYVLDKKPPALTLAQRLGLVDQPRPLLDEASWSSIKAKAATRDDFSQPCVICKEDIGKMQQVLLSCTHVFHRNCIQAFERFSGKKACPMCRQEQYQTRVVHDGSLVYRHKCAARIQAVWRGHVVRCWYRKLRETIPPKDEKLRKKFYEEKLRTITDRMVKSLDTHVAEFIQDIDRSLEASRSVFAQFDRRHRTITPDEWSHTATLALRRGLGDCPICLTNFDDYELFKRAVERMAVDTDCSSVSLVLPLAERWPLHQQQQQHQHQQQHQQHQHQQQQQQQAPRRKSVLLSCSHVFHGACLEAFEEFSVGERCSCCPVCRSAYQKCWLY